MLRWLKRKCTGKHSKRLRTSSISDLTRSLDYTRHTELNIYDEIDDSQSGSAYAVTSIIDIIDAGLFNEVCPLCRQQRHGNNVTCQCLDDIPTSPFKIRKDLGEDDDFSWLEYDMKSDSQSSLQRSRSDNAKRNGHMRNFSRGIRKEVMSPDDGSSSGFYETDDSSDDVVSSPMHRRSPATVMQRTNSPSSTPKMGCKVIKRSQSALNTRKHHNYQKSTSGQLLTMNTSQHTDDVTMTPCSPMVTPRLPRHGVTTPEEITDELDEEDIFDHIYANICIDINNLEIPKLRKSSYTSRSHGQNRLLNDLMKKNYDKQTFSVMRR